MASMVAWVSPVRTRSDEAITEEEANGFDDDGFAGPRFAGQDIEPGFELDVDRLDDCEITDAEEAQHVGATPIVSCV